MLSAQRVAFERRSDASGVSVAACGVRSKRLFYASWHVEPAGNRSGEKAAADKTRATNEQTSTLAASAGCRRRPRGRGDSGTGRGEPLSCGARIRRVASGADRLRAAYARGPRADANRARRLGIWPEVTTTADRGAGEDVRAWPQNARGRTCGAPMSRPCLPRRTGQLTSEPTLCVERVAHEQTRSALRDECSFWRSARCACSTDAARSPTALFRGYLIIVTTRFQITCNTMPGRMLPEALVHEAQKHAERKSGDKHHRVHVGEHEDGDERKRSNDEAVALRRNPKSTPRKTISSPTGPITTPPTRTNAQSRAVLET